jgi:hypothetical protein
VQAPGCRLQGGGFGVALHSGFHSQHGQQTLQFLEASRSVQRLGQTPIQWAQRSFLGVNMVAA